MKTFGLIGYPLEHSFSKKYFEEKFNKENIENVEYINLESSSLDDLFSSKKVFSLNGFNVTIPFKEAIIPYLDELSKEAKAIGAVNCVKKEGDKLIGYNTDYIGFLNSFKILKKSYHKKALILGNGGATKAIIHALRDLSITYQIVSRGSSFDYTDIDEKCLKEHQIIINCTPLGTYPKVDEFPSIPYQFLTDKHFLYDLVYNPLESRFLSFGKEKKCIMKSGMEMLEIQADQSWLIWNRKKYTY
jgi:shikimate dehydrogenase